MPATPLRLPDFLIAGAPRSGTTWLYSLLDRHPTVYMARPLRPEPKFFLLAETYARGLAYYSATWFAAAPTQCIVGEKSTNYLESALAAERIRHDLPAVKLLFLLREPVARAYSNYLWSRKNGLETEDFETALAREEEREAHLAPALRQARPHAYFSRGLYGDLLRPYFERFDRRQILCLPYEAIRDSPGALAVRVHDFLEIEPRPWDAADLGAINVSDPSAGPVPAGVRRRLAARYEEPNRRLQALLSENFAPWLGG